MFENKMAPVNDVFSLVIKLQKIHVAWQSGKERNVHLETL